MARFFQHLEPGANMGKVTRLKYIDDISDDELILFYFEDGSKCSSMYIASPEDEDPIKDKKLMVELTSPTNQWVFEKHEVIPEQSQKIRGADGTIYEAPSPDAKFEGGTGVHETTLKEEAKHGIRTEVKRPKKVARYSLEPDDIYMLSVHPELENGVKPVLSPGNIKTVERDMTVVRKPVVPQKKQNAQPAESSDFNFDEALNSSVVSDGLADKHTIKVPKSNNMFIDLESLSDKISFVIDGLPVLISKNEFINRLSVPFVAPDKKSQSNNNLSEIIDNEDVLIKNMIDKSKKNMCKISMALSLNIPPQEVYDTIKSVYEPEMLEQFTKSLSARYLSQENMLTSISNGLKAYYEKNSKKKNSEEEKK